MMMTVDIKCEEIESSMIKHLYYFGNGDKGYVGVVFNSHYTYVYKDVEFNTFMSLTKSKSVGHAFNDLIKENYNYSFSGYYKGHSPLEKMNITKI